MIEDPLFYAVAIPAVIISGMAKGGFLPALGASLAVPLMALVIPPVQAAGIMLPILVLMDFTSATAYRKDFDTANLKIIIPAAIVGVGLGWLTAGIVSNDAVRLLVGIIATVFALNWLIDRKADARTPAPRSVVKGGFWATIAGFTSFVSHAGAPPLQVYLLPQRLPNVVFAATSVMFFTTINLVKLVPYAALGQFSTATLVTAAALAPLAPLSVWAGVMVTRKLPQKPFYLLAYIALLLIGLKLIYDGATGIWSNLIAV